MSKKYTIVAICLAVAFLSSACGKKPIQEEPIQTPANVTPPPVQQPTPTVTPSGKKPQFVIMAFDGSYSFEMWENTLSLSEELTNSGHPLHFTYFLSGVYFLNFRKASNYQPPLKPAGTSLIGFGNSNLDIEKRVSYVNRAIKDGEEIGSHLNGHFDGSNWSKADWQQEFSQFKHLIFEIDKNNDVSEVDSSRYKISLSPDKIIGFRSPDLGKDAALYEVLPEQGYKYDTSQVAKHPDDWPSKLPNGIWEFPLAKIQYASTTSSLLSMDYNFYFKQTGAKDLVTKNTPEWQKFYNDTYTSYLNYFNNNYNGNRAPVFIGSHFSLWNDGVYWEAMKDFAKEVCTKPEVKCTTFSDLMQYLEETNSK